MGQQKWAACVRTVATCGCIGAAYGSIGAAYIVPSSGGCLPTGLRMAACSCPWAHMFAQGLRMAGHGDACGCPGISYGCTKAACDCLCGYILLLRTAIGRGRATFSCKGSSYGSHATDLPYMLHLAGPGWAARIPGKCPGRGILAVLGPLTHQTG